MSSTTSVFVGPSPTSNDPGNSNGRDDNGGMQRGASYFFGFLITFVVLLLVFVGCGVMSRRRFAARRRARFEWNLEPWAERLDGGDVGYVPPVLLEKGFVKARGGSLWSDINPLMAIVINPEKSKESDPVGQHNSDQRRSAYHSQNVDPNIEIMEIMAQRLSSSSRGRSSSSTRISSPNSGLGRVGSGVPRQNRDITSTQHEREEEGRSQSERERGLASHEHGVFHYLNPTSWLGPSRRRRPDQGQSRNDVEQGAHDVISREKPVEEEIKEPAEILQVAVFIEMPSRPSSMSSARQDKPPEYEIGIAQLPWHSNLNEIQSVL